jgi:hypothetical protein
MSPSNRDHTVRTQHDTFCTGSKERKTCFRQDEQERRPPTTETLSDSLHAQSGGLSRSLLRAFYYSQRGAALSRKKVVVVVRCCRPVSRCRTVQRIEMIVFYRWQTFTVRSKFPSWRDCLSKRDTKSPPLGFVSSSSVMGGCLFVSNLSFHRQTALTACSPVVKWLSLLTLNQASQVRILAGELRSLFIRRIRALLGLAWLVALSVRALVFSPFATSSAVALLRSPMFKNWFLPCMKEKVAETFDLSYSVMIPDLHPLKPLTTCTGLTWH